MSQKGYTLIELLVVLAILSLIGVAAFTRLKPFSKEKALDKGLDQIHSMLRLAQSNATAAFKCDGSVSHWMVEFKPSKKDIALRCGASGDKQTLNLEDDVMVDSISASCSGISFPSQPVTVLYTPLYGKTEFIVAKGVANLECQANVPSITITLKRQTLSKSFTISKGGAINVQQ